MEPGYRRNNQLILLEGRVAEKENLRSASNWALGTENFRAVAHLVSSLDYFWY